MHEDGRAMLNEPVASFPVVIKHRDNSEIFSRPKKLSSHEAQNFLRTVFCSEEVICHVFLFV